MEELVYECGLNHLTDPQNFWCEARPATTDEAVFDPTKDIAVHVTLRDSISNKTWRRAYFETLREMKSLGVEASREDVHQSLSVLRVDYLVKGGKPPGTR